MTEQILELRQTENITYNNGDFKCNLETPLYLEEGDSVVMANAFIDNSQSSEYKITIPEDVVVKIGVAAYFNNWDETGQSIQADSVTSGGELKGNPVQAQPTGQFAGGDVAGDLAKGKRYRFLNANGGTNGDNRELPDGKKYFLMKNLSFQDSSGFVVYTGVKLTPKNPGQSFGGFVLPLEYKLDNLVTKKKLIKIPVLLADTTIPLNLFGRENTMKTTLLSTLKDLYNVGSLTFESTAAPLRMNYFYPRELQTNILFRAGSYTPQEIALKITDIATSSVPLFDDDGKHLNPSRGRVVNNKLSGGTRASPSEPIINSGLSITLGIEGLTTKSYREDTGDDCFVDEEGKIVLTFSDKTLPQTKLMPNRLIGSTNFGMEYDEDVKKFKFVSLHTDFYGSGFVAGATKTTQGQSTVPAFEGILKGAYGANAQDTFFVSSLGGCVITSLEPHDFWYNTLGFDSNLNIANFEDTTGTQWEESPVPLPGNHQPIQEIPVRVQVCKNLFVGETFTQGALPCAVSQNLADGVRDMRVGARPENLIKVDGDSYEGTAYLSPAYTFNYDIIANETFLNNIYTNAYYLIEVTGLPNTYKGKNLNKNNVMAIVSRYYNTQNYTIGDASMSVLYQHTGEPISINSLGIRILLPNGKLAPLQNDNTVFLKIAKPDLNNMLKNKKK